MATVTGKFVVSAYDHRAERTYAYGPFTQKQMERFIQNDSHPEQHGEWDIMYVNEPELYGTGNAYSAYPY